MVIKQHKTISENRIGPDAHKAMPAVMAKLYHPIHVKSSLRIEEALQWKGSALAHMWKSLGSTALLSNYRELHIAPTDGKQFEGAIRSGLIKPLAHVAGVSQFCAGLNGAACDMAHLHVSEVLAFCAHKGLSVAIAFLDLVSAIASMRRAIAVPDASPDEQRHAHLASCGFSAAEVASIMALVCDAIIRAAAGASEHTIALLVEAHSGTWFSIEGLSTICTFMVGALAGKPLADLVFCAAVGVCMSQLQKEL